MSKLIAAITSSFLFLFANVSLAQPEGYNYDEDKVPKFELPDPLVLNSGKKVKNARVWTNKRRGQILELFKEHVYGRSPKPREDMHFEVTSVSEKALGGKAVRKEVTVYFSTDKNGPQMSILLFLPVKAKAATPTFLGVNFAGNHAIHPDSEITLSKNWMRPGDGIKDNRATEASRGAKASRWAVDMIIERGYGLATIYYGDIDPDIDDDFQNGVHPLFNKDGEKKPGPDGWGSIAAWAWG